MSKPEIRFTTSNLSCSKNVNSYYIFTNQYHFVSKYSICTYAIFSTVPLAAAYSFELFHITVQVFLPNCYLIELCRPIVRPRILISWSPPLLRSWIWIPIWTLSQSDGILSLLMIYLPISIRELKNIKRTIITIEITPRYADIELVNSVIVFSQGRWHYSSKFLIKHQTLKFVVESQLVACKYLM